MSPRSSPDRVATIALGPQEWSIEALSSDVLRVRLRRRGAASQPGSWAVLPDPWPGADLRREETGAPGIIRFSTAELQWVVDPSSRSWTLLDQHGLVLFDVWPGTVAPRARGGAFSLRLAEREAIFGLAETSGPLDRRGSIREFRNVDVLARASSIHAQLEAFYASIPLALSLREGRVAGLFWDNPSRQRWDIGNAALDRWSLTADEGDLDLYLFGGPTPARVLEQYTRLTGRMARPPRWALGFQQSRYSYRTAAELEAVADGFRRRALPCDVLYCDIDHLDGHRVFTFGKGYPNPRAMLARLRRRGFKVVFIVNPGVKDEARFPVLRRGRAVGAFVRQPGGRADFKGRVWPGRVRFPDFLHGPARAWWGREQRRLLELGAGGIWNDMNEPANFAPPDRQMNPECVHRTDHGPRRHAEVRNAYGSEMARTTREGWLNAFAALGPRAPRPFVLTRAGYAGVQRHAALWTGDNASTWEHLADSVPALLNLGLSGVALVGADVGGFIGNPTPELFARWLQLGVFTPFLRNHTNTGTRPQEPWEFGEEIEGIARTWLNLRYQLVPYLQVLVDEAVRTGAPIMRPLLWHHPGDPVAVACGDQFLLGERLLVAPVLRPGARARSVYLPRGEWYDFWTGERLPGGGHVLAPAPLDRVPLYVRAGALLPWGLGRSHLDGNPREPLFLHVWPGDRGRLEWYDDDGHTEAHAAGACVRRVLEFEPKPRGGQLTVEPPVGRYRGGARSWRVLLRDQTRKVSVRLNGHPVPVEQSPALRLAVFDLPLRDETVVARWH